LWFLFLYWTSAVMVPKEKDPLIWRGQEQGYFLDQIL